MILLQFSSAQGPEECCIAVEKALACFFQEAKKLSVIADTLEFFPSRYGLKSALISLEGECRNTIPKMDWHYSMAVPKPN